MVDNNKKTGFFSSATSRLVVTLCIAVVIIAIIVGIVMHLHSKDASQGSAAILTAPPSISSTPGIGDSTVHHDVLQRDQNVKNIEQARKDAGSAIPTIVNPTFQGNLDEFSQPTEEDTGLSKRCPMAKSIVTYRPNPATCLPNNLKSAREAGVTADELRCQGCACPSLKLAGYTAGDLKNSGYEAGELKKCGFSLAQLIAAGFDAADLKEAGFSADQLAKAGFTPGQLEAAGFDSDKACSPEALKEAHDKGVSAAVLRAKGCGAAALKAAGYTAAELKKAGFSAAELKAAGFTPAELRKAGFSAAALKAAGFNAADLKGAGFSDDDLKAAGFSPAEIKAADATAKICSVENLRKARAEGVSAAKLKSEGCSAAAMKAAGFTAGELRRAGFSAKDLKDAGFTAQQLHDAGFSAADLKNAGFDAKALRDAGYTASQLKAAGFTPSQLRAAGYSAAALKRAGFTAAQLKAAGYGAEALKDAGFSAKQLKEAGYSAGQLAAAGYSAADLVKAGFSPKQLHDAGFSAADLKAAGISPAQLLAAGYTKGDLLRAGFSPKESGFESPLNVAAAQHAMVQASGLDVSAAKGSLGDQLTALDQDIQKGMTPQERAQALQQQQGMMQQQVQSLLAAWGATSRQQMDNAIPEPKQSAAEQAAALAKLKQDEQGPILKAGDIMFAVLETSINSDETTPIMARVVSGPLKGGRLLGDFKRVDKKVLINFTLLNSPKYNHSLSITAVAIDPDTARTALSGEVNNHYLLRYGTLFASAFLEGWSNALTAAANNKQCQGSIVCNVSNDQNTLSTSKQMVVGLGQVGTRYSQVMAKNFTLPPTIKIPGGVGFGLLLMRDVTLPVATASAKQQTEDKL